MVIDEFEKKKQEMVLAFHLCERNSKHHKYHCENLNRVIKDSQKESTFSKKLKRSREV